MAGPEDGQDCRSCKQDAKKHLQTHIEINILPMDLLHPHQGLARCIDVVLAALLQSLLAVALQPAVGCLIKIAIHGQSYGRRYPVDARRWQLRHGNNRKFSLIDSQMQSTESKDHRRTGTTGNRDNSKNELIE